MKKNYLIISFYTPKYKIEASYLQTACDKHSLLCKILPVKNTTWQQACAYKATFIKQQLKKYKKPVVWIDADAYIHQSPSLFDSMQCDFAARFIKDASFPNQKKILSSTLFFNYTKESLLLLDRWIQKCKAYPEVFDQNLLTDVFYAHQNDFSYIALPKEYALIINESTGMNMDQVVILHTQASRVLAHLDPDENYSDFDLELIRLYRKCNCKMIASQEAKQNLLYLFYLEKKS